MAFTKVHLLPMVTSIVFPGSIITTYIIAVLLGHVDPDFPYISDTGTMKPESCLFSQMMNISAALMLLCMYVRYKHVEQHHRDHMSATVGRCLRLNRLALVLGVVATFGLSLLSNFQESQLFKVHLAGFVLAALGGLGYVWLQTALTFQAVPLLNRRTLAWSRLALSTLATVALVATVLTGLLSHRKVKNNRVVGLWPGQQGFALHVTSAAMEWTLMLSFNFFLLSFSVDFKNIALASPKVFFLLDKVEVSPESVGAYQSDDRISPLHPSVIH